MCAAAAQVGAAQASTHPASETVPEHQTAGSSLHHHPTQYCYRDERISSGGAFREVPVTRISPPAPLSGPRPLASASASDSKPPSVLERTWRWLAKKGSPRPSRSRLSPKKLEPERLAPVAQQAGHREACKGCRASDPRSSPICQTEPDLPRRLRCLGKLAGGPACSTPSSKGPTQI